MRMYFEPKVLHIKLGDTVTWVNVAREEHNILSYPDGYPIDAEPLDSPYLKLKGEKWSHRFTVAGTYEYHCLPHIPMGMDGTIIVSRPSQDREFHTPSKVELHTYLKRLREYFDEDEFQYRSRTERGKARNRKAARLGG